MIDSGIRIGQRYGKLEVLRQDGVLGAEKAWIVRCDCGNVERVRSYALKNKRRACVNCTRIKDILGQRFNRLVAIKPTGKRINDSVVWECKCDCGNIVEYPENRLICGDAQSCKKCGLRESVLSAGISKHNSNACINGSKYDQIKEDRKPNKNNTTTKIKGVWYDKRRKKYVAELRFQRQKVFMKRFDDIDDAVKARKEAEEQYFEPVRKEYLNRMQKED